MALLPLKLNRLQRFDKLTDNTGVSTRFQTLWQETVTALEENNGELIDALILIAAVQSTANSKNRTFVATSAPTADATGDLWLDSDDGNKPYRWDGATWVAVQDVGAELARVSINPDGTIANDKVVNDSVLAGAVYAQDAEYTPGSTNINSTSSGPYNTWIDVATKAFTSTGREVQVPIAARVEVIDNCKLQYRLLCDGTQVEDAIGPVTVNVGDQVPLSFMWAHTPTAAAHTYKLQVRVNSNGITVHNPVLAPSENRNL